MKKASPVGNVNSLTRTAIGCVSPPGAPDDERPQSALPELDISGLGAPAAGPGPLPSQISSRSMLGAREELVGEEGEPVTDGLDIDEAHGLLAAGLAEEALAGPEHDRKDDQPQLIDQVMLD